MEAGGGVLAGSVARPAERWADAGVWVGDGLRREVFFLDSAGVRLYGSLYRAVERSHSTGLVICGSWGVEADRSDPLVRAVALAMARLGGASLVFHYPGYGDSFGDLAGLDLDDLAGAGGDAVAEAARRCPEIDTWILAGLMFGASVACLARRRVAPGPLLLVQPALRPGTYLGRLAKSSRPLAPGPASAARMEVGTAPGMAYGYPIPARIAEHAAAADAAVAAALTAFDGDGAVIRHAEPQDPDFAPERFERVEVPGAWRFGSQNHPRLGAAAASWLEQRVGGGRE